jgi:hypothetical protein
MIRGKRESRSIYVNLSSLYYVVLIISLNARCASLFSSYINMIMSMCPYEVVAMLLTFLI